MRETFIDKTDLEYTNAILDEHRDKLFNLKDFKSINKSITILNDKIEKIPEKYRKLFADYDHLFHKSYEYEICMMYFLGLGKGICLDAKK